MIPYPQQDSTFLSPSTVCMTRHHTTNKHMEQSCFLMNRLTGWLPMLSPYDQEENVRFCKHCWRIFTMPSLNQALFTSFPPQSPRWLKHLRPYWVYCSMNTCPHPVAQYQYGELFTEAVLGEQSAWGCQLSQDTQMPPHQKLTNRAQPR